MYRARRLLLAAGSGCALFALAASASAQESGTLAEALFRDAQRLLSEGHVHEACVKFAASQKADPALGTRLNQLEPTLHKVALDAEAPADGLVVVLDTTSITPAAFGVGIPVDPGEHV